MGSVIRPTTTAIITRPCFCECVSMFSILGGGVFFYLDNKDNMFLTMLTR